MTDQVKEVSIALGDTVAERLLKERVVTRPRIRLNFADYPVIIKAFVPMVRAQAFDIGELSLVTFLQALEAGKPLRLLPIVINGFMHHSSMFYNPAHGPLTPQELKGKRVSVRSYTQTMGMWARGILKEQYGVFSDEVTWICREEAHVAEYKCPTNVEIRKDASDAKLLDSGEVCAAIVSAAKMKDARFKPLLPHPEAAAAAWYAKHNTVMINHLVAVTEEFLRKDPSAVQDVYDMLCHAADMTREERKKDGLSAVGYGADRIWNGGAIQLGMQYSIEQKLISRTFQKNEIFADVTESSSRFGL